MSKNQKTNVLSDSLQSVDTKGESSINIKKFNDFLLKHKVPNGTKCTHTAFGEPWGSFNIEGSDNDVFLSLYKKVYGKTGLHIIERPRVVGPFLIDIDFNIDASKHENRQYRKQHYEFLIKETTYLFKKYLNVNHDDLDAFVCEKASPTYDKKKNIYKDGFHISYPLVPIDAPTRFFIFDELKKRVEKNNKLSDIPTINDLDTILDKSVIYSNGWFMYGSVKDGRKDAYKLTNIYSHDMKQDNVSNFSDDDIISLMSIQQYSGDDKVNIKKKYMTEEVVQKLEFYNNKYVLKKRVEKLDTKENPNKTDKTNEIENKNKNKNKKDNKVKLRPGIENDDISCDDNDEHKGDIEYARELVKVLSKKRADKYLDWISLGWALHNIDDSLFEDFKAFSKQSSKYEDGCCERVWNKAKDTGYGIGTLCHWAKKDSHSGYMRAMRNYLTLVIKVAESGKPDDIALVAYKMYRHEFKCTSIVKDTWYQFKGHRWVLVDKGYTLSLKLAREVSMEFLRLATARYKDAEETQEEDTDGFRKKGKKNQQTAEKLKDSGFNASVMSFCSKQFIDETFESTLDGNFDLLGFNNGVYDLQNGIFRDGLPDDRITLSTGYDYQEFEKDDPTIKEIKEFFSKVHRDVEMREYILTLMSSYLSGHNLSQNFVLWTGGGSNGKSTTVDLMKYTLGGYFGILPVTILTQKRGKAGAATPELADKRGKRLLVIQEPEHDDKIYVGYMKELTGSDWITARALYGNVFEYKPQFKLLLTCNKLPHIPSNDGGTWRRLRVTLWESQFVDYKPKYPHQFPKDPLLLQKLKNWNAGLVWILLKEYFPIYNACQGKIKEPKKVTIYTEKYQQDSDIYFDYLSESFDLTKQDEDSELLQQTFKSFKEWIKEGGYDLNINIKDFKNYLESAGFKIDGKRIIGLKMKGSDNN